MKSPFSASLTSKTLALKPTRRPPDLPLAGVQNQAKFLLPLIEFSQVSSKAFLLVSCKSIMSGTIIRGTLKTPNSQLVTPISIKLQRPDGYD
jgi:hypothetical protein